MANRIVVIGGGFAGVKCAKTLRRLLSKSRYEIVLFASENHMVFHPLLAEVASASINPKDMAAPLRLLLTDTSIRMEEITGIKLDANQVCYETPDGSPGSMTYDQLVIACGTISNLSIVPGMADHAFPMKTAGDALALQIQLINQMEKAEVCENPEIRKRLLTFAVVGGGFSGVEVAGEIQDFIERSARYYSNFGRSDVSVTLIHSRDQILPEVSSSLRDFAREKMERHGIKFVLNAGASYCTADGVGLRNGEFVPAGTVICTIGTRPSPIIEKLEVSKEHGRIAVNPDMSLPGFENVWAIGDCAAVPNAYDGALSPTTAQFAERQGTQVARNIVGKLQGNATQPFSHKSLGTLCCIGGRNAVADVLGVKLAGTIAWIAWRGTYLIKLPSLMQQIAVAATWTLGFFFPPALTGPRIDRTRVIGHAYHRAGDWIFRKGDPSNQFYAITSGEVEIVNDEEGNMAILGVLGKDDFFGDDRPGGSGIDSKSYRARTDVQLLILGRNVFEQVSEAVAPLRKAVENAIKKRQTTWESFDAVKSALVSIPLSELIKPISGNLLKASDCMAHAVELMRSDNTESLYVVDENKSLLGIVSRTDLLRASDSIVTGKDVHSIYAGSFMATPPICVLKSDDTTTAALTMREHGFKSLPVIDDRSRRTLVGSIRAEDILAAVTNRFFDRQPQQSET